MTVSGVRARRSEEMYAAYASSELLVLTFAERQNQFIYLTIVQARTRLLSDPSRRW